MEINYYHIGVRPGTSVCGTLHYADEHDEVYLGCHTRLASAGKAATFICVALANEFMLAVTPELRKRHGETTETSLVKVTFHAWNEEEKRVLKLYERAEEHAVIVRARIDANDYRPNVFDSDGKLKPKLTRRKARLART